MKLSTLKRRWHALFHKQELDIELDEELQYHLERDIEQNIQSGMTREEARYAALKQFGGLMQSKEASRDARGVKFIENTLQDARYSFAVDDQEPCLHFDRRADFDVGYRRKHRHLQFCKRNSAAATSLSAVRSYGRAG